MDDKLYYKMQQFDNKTLIKIISINRKDYTKGAIEAASKVLIEREVDISGIKIDYVKSEEKSNYYNKTKAPVKEKTEFQKSREERAKLKLYVAALAGPIFIYMGSESHKDGHTYFGWFLIIVFWPLLYWHMKKK